jgi:hypothetical protein
LPLAQIPNNGYSEYASNGYYCLCEQARNATRHIRVSVVLHYQKPLTNDKIL